MQGTLKGAYEEALQDPGGLRLQTERGPLGAILEGFRARGPAGRAIDEGTGPLYKASLDEFYQGRVVGRTGVGRRYFETPALILLNANPMFAG